MQAGTRRGTAPRLFANHTEEPKTSARHLFTTTPSTTWRDSSTRRPDHRCCRRRRLRDPRHPRVLRMHLHLQTWPGPNTEEDVFCRRHATSPIATKPLFATTILYRTMPTSTAPRMPSIVLKPLTAARRTAMPPTGYAPT